MLPRRRLPVVARRRARATLANPYLRSNLRLQRLPPRPLAYRICHPRSHSNICYYHQDLC